MMCLWLVVGRDRRGELGYLCSLGRINVSEPHSVWAGAVRFTMGKAAFDCYSLLRGLPRTFMVVSI